jgi:hypothetical protein
MSFASCDVIFVHSFGVEFGSEYPRFSVRVFSSLPEAFIFLSCVVHLQVSGPDFDSSIWFSREAFLRRSGSIFLSTVFRHPCASLGLVFFLQLPSCLAPDLVQQAVHQFSLCRS